jgi:hypothetical protein
MTHIHFKLPGIFHNAKWIVALHVVLLPPSSNVCRPLIHFYIKERQTFGDGVFFLSECL